MTAPLQNGRSGYPMDFVQDDPLWGWLKKLDDGENDSDDSDEEDDEDTKLPERQYPRFEVYFKI